MEEKQLAVFIRDAAFEDVSHCVELVKQLGYNIPPEYMKKFFSRFGKDKVDRVFVAISDEEIVGLAHVHIREFARRATLESIVVDYKYRKRGIGKLLFNAVEEHAIERKLQILEFISSNNRESNAHQFYNKIGYGANNKAYFQKLLMK